jgi:hypothetical protein
VTFEQIEFMPQLLDLLSLRFDRFRLLASHPLQLLELFGQLINQGLLRLD